jgi:transposase
MGWSGWEKFANLTTRMNNKTIKLKTQRKPKQAKSDASTVAGTPGPGSAPVASSAPLVLPSPLSAAQFQAELAQLASRSGPRDPATEALVNTILEPQPKAPKAPKASAAPGSKACGVIKLGIDVHANRYVVVRQVDGATPQPAQAFSPERALLWIQKQTELAEKVYSCYEAGPFGYGLHRQLTALKVTNYVVRPRNWDEYGRKDKNDKRDARELALGLDRLVGGNTKAFSVVRVPSEAEEQARSRSRQREALQREKQRLAAQGRSHGLYYGARVEGTWWVESAWKELVVPPIVLELLTPLRRLILAVEQELASSTQALIQAPALQELPVGLGKLTYEILEREVGQWDRFKNRRQVGSYGGMCPCEDSSDQRRFQGSINKHGNPRVRTPLVEATWRLIRFQPTYKPVAKWLPTLSNPKTTKGKRKQIVVAIARQFSVDWWRVRTGRCSLQELGLVVKPAPATAAPPTSQAPNPAGQKAATPA